MLSVLNEKPLFYHQQSIRTDSYVARLYTTIEWSPVSRVSPTWPGVVRIGAERVLEEPKRAAGPSTMRLKALLFLCGSVAALRAPIYPPDNVNEHLTLSRLKTQYNPGPLTELKVTSNVVNLKRANSWSLSSVYVQALRRQSRGALGAERANECIHPPSARRNNIEGSGESLTITPERLSRAPFCRSRSSLPSTCDRRQSRILGGHRQRQ